MLKIVITTIVVGALAWGAHKADLGRIQREQFAQEMSDEGGNQYIATGLLSTTLGLSAKRGNEANCDAFLDTVRHSNEEGWSDVRATLRAEGFTRIACGESLERLP